MRSFIFNLSRFYDVFIYEILLFFREKQPIYNSICPQFLKYSYLVKTILKGAFLSPFGLLSDKPLKWKHLAIQKVSNFFAMLNNSILIVFQMFLFLFFLMSAVGTMAETQLSDPIGRQDVG